MLFEPARVRTEELKATYDELNRKYNEQAAQVKAILEEAKAITNGFDTRNTGLMILQDNKIAVDPVNKSSITEVSIYFYGYLAQASRGNDASSVFINCFETQ